MSALTLLPTIQIKKNSHMTQTRNLAAEYFQKYRKHDCAICFRENIKKVRLPCCGQAFDSSMAYCVDCLKKVCSFDKAAGVGSCPTCYKGFKMIIQTNWHADQDSVYDGYRCVKAKLYNELTDEEFRERYTHAFAERRLGMDLKNPNHQRLLWIAKEMLSGQLPVGWYMEIDSKSKRAFFEYENERGEVERWQWEHPEESEFVLKFKNELEKLECKNKENIKHKAEMEKMIGQAQKFMKNLENFNIVKLPKIIEGMKQQNNNNNISSSDNVKMKNRKLSYSR